MAITSVLRALVGYHILSLIDVPSWMKGNAQECT